MSAGPPQTVTQTMPASTITKYHEETDVVNKTMPASTVSDAKPKMLFPVQKADQDPGHGHFNCVGDIKVPCAAGFYADSLFDHA